MKRVYGWRRQVHDPRDIYHAPKPKTAPAMISLASGMGPQLDQGDLGACGPNAGDELITFDQIAQGEPRTFASRLFIYYNTRELMGTVTEDSGVANRPMLQALASSGFCPESDWPYEVSQFAVQPPQQSYTDALPNKITNYAAVIQNLNQMQLTLAGGKPFIFGFECFKQLESAKAAKTGIVTDPPRRGSPIGGHDVTICGYNATTQAIPGITPGKLWPAGTFLFRNHWLNADGTPWGDGGYGYISFAYAVNPRYAGDFWCINSVP